jgi:hypothetical protein
MSLMDLLRRECSKFGLVAALALSGCSNTIVKTVYVYPETASAVGDGYIDSSLPEVSEPDVSVDVSVPEEASSVVDDISTDINLVEVGEDVKGEVKEDVVPEPDIAVPEEVSSTLDSLVQDTGDNIRFLDSCKTSGWEDGKTYVLTGDVVDKLGPNGACFYLENVKGVTFDGKGHSIKLSTIVDPSPTSYGIFVKNSKDININNVSVSAKDSYLYGILLVGVDKGILEGVSLEKCVIGILIGNHWYGDSTQAIDLTKMITVKEVICKENLVGILIDPETEDVSLSGMSILDNKEGLSISTSLKIRVTNSKFTGNTGVALKDQASHSFFEGITLSNNGTGLVLYGTQTTLGLSTSCDNVYNDIECNNSSSILTAIGLYASKVKDCAKSGIIYTPCSKP